MIYFIIIIYYINLKLSLGSVFVYIYFIVSFVLYNTLLLMLALKETLEADVRSKFQTKRAIEMAQRPDWIGSVGGELPFDNLIVRYKWTEERSIEVVELVITSSPVAPNTTTDYDVSISDSISNYAVET